MLRFTRKPFLGGTSNTRQGDLHGMYRCNSVPFHSSLHSCCSTVMEAEFLSIASIPGLSMTNIDTHTVPINPHSQLQKYGGLTLRPLVENVTSDPSFNGHFILWFMDNDNDFIMAHRYTIESAVAQYVQFLSQLFQGIHLDRLYLTTVPFRAGDFHYNRQYRSKTLQFKREFNVKLRNVFGNDSGQINDFPVTLVDLNLCFPEIDMWRSEFYCSKEKWGHRGVHINARYYKRFLTLLRSLLESHSGLPFLFAQVTATQSLSHSSSLLPALSVAVTLQSASGVLTVTDSSSLPPSTINLPSLVETNTHSALPSSYPSHATNSTFSLSLPESSGTSLKVEAGTLPFSLSTASPCEQPATHIDALETKNKPKKSKKRGKHSKNRNIDPFISMDL